MSEFQSPVITPVQFWDSKYGQEEMTFTPEKRAYYESQGIWKLLSKYLKTTGHYLDVGCGMGTWILFLKKKRFNVDGCDITPQTIKRLKNYDPALQLHVAGISQIPYANELLDGVLAIGVLEYVHHNELGTALREVHRVTKSGGIFFVEVPLRNLLRTFLYLPLKRLRGRKIDTTYFTRRELTVLLEKNGFTVLELTPHEMPWKRCHHGLYNDWSFLRGKRPKHLNFLGLILKYSLNAISPWIAATGVLVVAQKQ